MGNALRGCITASPEVEALRPKVEALSPKVDSIQDHLVQSTLADQYAQQETRENVQMIQQKLETIQDLVTPKPLPEVPKPKEPEYTKWGLKQTLFWLECIGLRKHYEQAFRKNGINGVVLEMLELPDFERDFGVSKVQHKLSLERALRELRDGKHPSYHEWQWTADAVSEWLEGRGLSVLADHFRDNGVHGGVLFSLSKQSFQDFFGVCEFSKAKSDLILESLWQAICRTDEENGPQKDVGQVSDWGRKEVDAWLKDIDLGHLQGVFKDHHVNGALLLSLCDQESFFSKESLIYTMKLSRTQAARIFAEVKSLKGQRHVTRASSRLTSRRKSVQNLASMFVPRKKRISNPNCNPQDKFHQNNKRTIEGCA